MGNGRLHLTEKDFVAAYDAEGNELGYKVPKHWGPEELPAGVTTKKPKSASSSAAGSNTGGNTKAVPDPDAEPSGNATTEAWAEYAVKVKGAKPEDLLDDKGDPLGRDELRTKYAAPSA